MDIGGWRCGKTVLSISRGGVILTDEGLNAVELIKCLLFLLVRLYVVLTSNVKQQIILRSKLQK